MQVTREDLNPCTVKLTVVCDPAEVKEGFDKALKQIAKKVKLPGFRPGHAPKSMVESLISKEELYDNAAEIIVRNSFKRAIDEQALQPDATVRPNVELTKLDQESNEAEYTAKVALPAKVELGDYQGLPVEKPSTEVTEEEIDYQIEELRRRRSTREAIMDRGVQEGDMVGVNVKPEGAEGEGKTFMSVAGQTFPQLDEAIMGMKVEEMKSLDLTFPSNFVEKDWADKTMKVQVTINSLSAVKMPELDEAFAQSLRTENVEDLRTRLREGIAQAKEQMVREIVHERLLEALQARSTVHVSDNMWEGLAARRLQETAEEQRKENKTLEQYAAENGMTLDQLSEAWKEKAKMHVERALLIRDIFTKEQMQLTEEELNRELYAMASEFQVEAEQMFRMLQENQALDELHFRAISRKVGDYLLENAEVKEVAVA
ncbi:MAG TPA: trigger factor [Fimbriimonas sp.]